MSDKKDDLLDFEKEEKPNILDETISSQAKKTDRDRTTSYNSNLSSLDSELNRSSASENRAKQIHVIAEKYDW